MEMALAASNAFLEEKAGFESIEVGHNAYLAPLSSFISKLRFFSDIANYRRG